MSDATNPPHYKDRSPEPITVIEGWGLGFCLGNTVKYLARAGLKDPSKEIEDLEKARWYLERHIALLRGQRVVSGDAESSFDIDSAGNVHEVLR